MDVCGFWWKLVDFLKILEDSGGIGLIFGGFGRIGEDFGGILLIFKGF